MDIFIMRLEIKIQIEKCRQEIKNFEEMVNKVEDDDIRSALLEHLNSNRETVDQLELHLSRIDKDWTT